MPRPHKQRSGFTLIETIFATFIFSLVIIAVMNLYPSAAVAVKRSEGEIQANNLAQSCLEEIRATAFNTLTTNSAWVPPVQAPFEAVTLGGITYTPTVQVIDPSDAPYNLTVAKDTGGEPLYLKIARVTVAWEFQGRVRTSIHEVWIHNVPR